MRDIFDKTSGHCHFCGHRIFFARYGFDRRNRKGFWEVDHVIQRDKGGRSVSANYLPACTRCNRLRWHRRGRYLRESILLGLIARDQIKGKTAIGRMLRQVYRQRLTANRRRRNNRRKPK